MSSNSNVQLNIANRAEQVLRDLNTITSRTKEGFFQLCDLLLEANDGQYHTVWGYGNFGVWVEETDLDLSSRTAYYLISIAKKVQQLGIPREELLRGKISSIKEIFRLDPATQGSEMLRLLAKAEDASVEEIKAEVAVLTAKAGESPKLFKTFKIETEIKETLDQAFELCRRMNGSTINPVTGDLVDISDSQCLEMLAVSYLQDPNNHPEG